MSTIEVKLLCRFCDIERHRSWQLDKVQANSYEKVKLHISIGYIYLCKSYDMTCTCLCMSIIETKLLCR